MKWVQVLLFLRHPHLHKYSISIDFWEEDYCFASHDWGHPSWQLRSKRMLPGLRSRCITPAEWMYLGKVCFSLFFYSVWLVFYVFLQCTPRQWTNEHQFEHQWSTNEHKFCDGTRNGQPKSSTTQKIVSYRKIPRVLSPIFGGLEAPQSSLSAPIIPFSRFSIDGIFSVPWLSPLLLTSAFF